MRLPLLYFFCATLLLGCQPVSKTEPPGTESSGVKSLSPIGEAGTLDDLRDREGLATKIGETLRKRNGRAPRPEDYLKYADEMMDQHDHDMAVMAASLAIAVNPRYAEAYLVRAKAQSKSVLGDMKSVKKDLEKAIQLKSDLPDAYELLADFYDQEKRYDKAVAAWSRAIANNKSDRDLYRHRSASLYALGRRQEAIDDLDRYIAIRPDRPIGYRIKAGLLVDMGRFDDALKAYELALKYQKGTTKAQIFHLRGRLLARMKRYDDAIKDFSAMLEIDPRDDDALRLRGDQYLKLGQYDKAISDYTNAINVSPDFARASLLARSRAYRKIGRNDLATQDEKRAFRLSERPAEKPVFEFKE